MVVGPMDRFLTNRGKNQRRKTQSNPRITGPKTSQTRIREHFHRDTSALRQEKEIYHESKQDNTLRLYSQNVRGLSMDLPEKLMSISDIIRNLQVDITCLQEVNDSLPKHNRQKLANALSQEGKFAHLSISTLNPYHNKTTHQPGGNLIALTSQT